MTIDSRATIVNKLTTSAKNLKTVRERASLLRETQALGEPSAIQPATTQLQDGLPIAGQVPGRNPSV